MARRMAGVAFCAIAAFLFAVRYIAAAIFASGVSTFSGELFQSMLGYIGTPLLVLSIISLVLGILYLPETLVMVIWFKRKFRQPARTDD